MAGYAVYTVDDVVNMLGISKSKAYKMVQSYNKELAAKGYITISGKIPKAYLEEKLYGFKPEKTKARR